MKEKTFKDLGLDDAEKYITDIFSKYDLGDLQSILEDQENEKK